MPVPVGYLLLRISPVRLEFKKEHLSRERRDCIGGAGTQLRLFGGRTTIGINDAELK